MRSQTNGFIFGFIIVLVFLNAPFLVAADATGSKSKSSDTHSNHTGTTSSTALTTETVKLYSSEPSPPSMEPSIMMPTSPVLPVTTSTPLVLPSATSATQGALVVTHNNLSSGAIAGIVVAIVLPLLVIGASFIYRRRKRQRQRRPSHDGPTFDITGESDPIGSPVYEKHFIPTPFLTDKEARHLGYDQATRRIGPKFTTTDHLDSEKTYPYDLSDLSPAHTQTSLPVLHSNSGYSPEPPEDSRTTLAAQRLSTTSSEDTLTEETPSPYVSPYPRSPSEEAAGLRIGRAAAS